MYFSDIHTHVLHATDDGAKKREDMYEMIDAAYKSGTRLICATPHFAPDFFGDNREASEHSFKVLKEYRDRKYPDLELIFGNELYYRHDCISWLKGGLCRTMGDTNYLLVEFEVHDSEDKIAEGIYRLQNLGYTPILAHAERYKNLSVGRVWSFRENGVLIQINCESIVSAMSFGQKKRLKALLEKNYVDFVSSDTHNLKNRSPDMSKSYEIFVEKYGKRRADDLFRKNALRIFGSKNSEEETE